MNAKEMLKTANVKKTKFFRKDRVSVRIIKDTFVKNQDGSKRPGFVKGKIMKPHKLMGEQMVKDGIAEYVK